MALILGGGKTGGASLPVPSTQDFFGGPVAVAVANGAVANIGFAGPSVHGSDLVDLTDQTEPVVRVGGIYAVAVCVTATSDMSVGGFFDLQVQLDAEGVDLGVQQDSRVATAAQPKPGTAQTAVGYIPTSGTIIVSIHNKDGASAVSFAMQSAFIQRIT